MAELISDLTWSGSQNPVLVTEEGSLFIHRVCSPEHELDSNEYQRAKHLIAVLYERNRYFGEPDGQTYEESNLPIPFEGDPCLVKLNDGRIVGAIYLGYGIMQLGNGRLILNSMGSRRWVSWGPA